MHVVHRYGKKDPSAALGMTRREEGLSHIPFHSAVRANLRPFQRKEGEVSSRITAFPVSSFRAKREIFLAHQ